MDGKANNVYILDQPLSSICHWVHTAPKHTYVSQWTKKASTIAEYTEMILKIFEQEKGNERAFQIIFISIWLQQNDSNILRQRSVSSAH